MSNLIFGMCKSQHTVDVKAHHERQARKKDTKFVKEIHSHLNMQPLAHPLPLKVKKGRRLSHLMKGLLASIWRLRCSSGMRMLASVASALTMVAWLGHLHLTLLHLILLIQLKPMKMKARTKTTSSEASRRPPQHLFGVNDKGGER
jgi:hypothetical protein